MSDRRKSISSSTPRHTDEPEPFRELFLSLLTVPEDRAAFRRVGALVHEMALDFSHHWPPRGESLVQSDLRAAAKDLRVVGFYLAEVTGGDPGEPEAVEDIARALKARDWGARILAIAQEMEAELDPAPPEDGR